MIDDFCIRLRDKTCEIRTAKDEEEMLDAIQNVVNLYGFSIVCSGPWQGFGKVWEGEQDILKRLSEEG